MNELRERLISSRVGRAGHSHEPLFVEANLDPHYWPFRGIVWSFVVHASILAALVSITLPRPRAERSLRDRAVIIDINDLDDVLYLPTLGRSEPKKRSAPEPPKTLARSRAADGLSYPGPQPILSDVPNPTNHIQTLLQPSLSDPYVLRQPLSLPNIVQLAETAPALKALAPPPVKPKFKMPDATAPAAERTSTAHLDVALTAPARPLAAPRVEPNFKTPEASTPAAQFSTTAPLDVALTAPARPLAAPRAESKFKTLEASTPAAQFSTTAPLDVALTAPAGPLAAPRVEPKFKTPDASTPAVQRSTAARLDVALNAPAKPLAAPLAESKLKVPEASAPAVRPTAAPAPPLDVALPSPLAPAALVAPPEPPRKPNDSKNLLALSPMPGKPDQPVAVPSGEARGRFAISPNPNLDFPGLEPGIKGGSAGSASASGNADADNGPSDSGNRTTSTAESNPFPGITILGAAVDPPTSRNTAAIRNPEPLQTSYGIMILATGSSGGGLPDFGIFKNEQVHTVYLDMRRTVLDSAPSWTVEYALPQTDSPGDLEARVSTQLDVVLPFPIEKEQPVMPASLVSRYPQRMVIVFGIINVNGKMEQLSVKDTPNHLLDEPVLSALKKWTFRPARRNDEVVPVKALLGIPLWTPE